MSQLQELIRKLCPNGVEYKKLEDVCIILDSQRIPISKSKRKFGIYPYYGANGIQDYIDDFLFHGKYVLVGEDGSVINKDNSPIVHWATGKIWVNNHAHILSEKTDIMRLRFLYHALSTIDISSIIRGTPPKLNQKNLKNITIPTPPLEVQNEIVRILDTFTSHAAELQAELQARKEQYEYYRNKLFTFDKNNEDIKWILIKDFTEIGTGSSNTQEELSVGLYPFFVRSPIVRRKNEYEFDETAIITSGDGVGVGKIFHYIEGKYALHQRAYRIHVCNEKIIPKFLFHYMRCKFYDYITRNAYSSSVTSIRKPMLLNFPIPLLSITEQQRIVSILDKFETLVNDLTEGIPAEIAAVQEQYEYYRNKLLSFPKLEA